MEEVCKWYMINLIIVHKDIFIESLGDPERPRVMLNHTTTFHTSVVDSQDVQDMTENFDLLVPAANVISEVEFVEEIDERHIAEAIEAVPVSHCLQCV